MNSTVSLVTHRWTRVWHMYTMRYYSVRKKSEQEPNVQRIRETLELPEDTPVLLFSAEKGIGRDELLDLIFKDL